MHALVLSKTFNNKAKKKAIQTYCKRLSKDVSQVFFLKDGNQRKLLHRMFENKNTGIAIAVLIDEVSPFSVEENLPNLLFSVLDDRETFSHNTPLHCAAYYNNIEVARNVLELVPRYIAESLVCNWNGRGQTPIRIAEIQSFEMLADLLRTHLHWSVLSW